MEGSLPESHLAESAWKTAGSVIRWCYMYGVPLTEDFVSFAVTMACPVQDKVNVILYKSGIQWLNLSLYPFVSNPARPTLFKISCKITFG